MSDIKPKIQEQEVQKTPIKINAKKLQLGASMVAQWERIYLPIQESRLLGEISITSDMQMTPPLWKKVKKN